MSPTKDRLREQKDRSIRKQKLIHIKNDSEKDDYLLQNLARKKVVMGDLLTKKFAKFTESGAYRQEIDFKVAETLKALKEREEEQKIQKFPV